MISQGMGVYLRGIAMGAADLVPGVSGGTIALITGIYSRLIAAIASLGPSTLAMLMRGRVVDAWRAIDGNFLLMLSAGIATAVIGLAALLDWLLSNYPLPLWAGFSGLVLASSWSLVVSNYDRWMTKEWLLFTGGIGVALFVGLTGAVQLPVTPLGVFFAGCIAICAMILPGISGSFLLLLMGMYEPVIKALVSVDLLTLTFFALGCAVGLLLFSRLLQGLLRVAEQITMATLLGFLVGSLIILWPWQLSVSTVLDRHGDLRDVQTLPVTPVYYAEHVGDPMLLLCFACFIFGALVVTVLQVLSVKREKS